MKKILVLAIAVLMTVVVLAGCGKDTAAAVSTTVPAKYVDDFAKKYASDVKVDDDGNVSYSFTPDQYEEFERD